MVPRIKPSNQFVETNVCSKPVMSRMSDNNEETQSSKQTSARSVLGDFFNSIGAWFANVFG